MILRAVEDTAGGCDALNRLAMREMRRWVRGAITSMVQARMTRYSQLAPDGAVALGADELSRGMTAERKVHFLKDALADAVSLATSLQSIGELRQARAVFEWACRSPSRPPAHPSPSIPARACLQPSHGTGRDYEPQMQARSPGTRVISSLGTMAGYVCAWPGPWITPMVARVLDVHIAERGCNMQQACMLPRARVLPLSLASCPSPCRRLSRRPRTLRRSSGSRAGAVI